MRTKANKNEGLADAENRWKKTDFRQMAYITGLRQHDYSPEDGYQEYVDACNNYWDRLDRDEKIRIWKEYN